MAPPRNLVGNDYNIKPGDKFWRLTVIKRVEDRESSRGTLQSYFLCRCECGNTKIILGRSLHRGKTLSCGCLQHDKLMARNIHHGVYDTHIYSSYHEMIERCTNPSYKSFERYGGRGITICSEWYNYSDSSINIDLFRIFYNWAITHPTFIDGYTLDRINVDGNYEPSNCIWSNPKQQANNRSNNRLIDFNGYQYNIGNISNALGIDYDRLRNRLANHNYNMNSIYSNYQFTNEYSRPVILSKKNIPIQINGVYFEDEYGRVYNEQEWFEYISRPYYGIYKVNDNGFIIGPME